VNTLPAIRDDLAVSLEFFCGKAGFYQIGLSERTSVDPSVKIYLQDQFNLTMNNLSEIGQYTFYHDPSFERNRFRLFLNPAKEIHENNGSSFTVYTVKNQVHITRITTEILTGHLFIYTLTGQKIHEEILNEDRINSFTLPVPTGYYILYIAAYQYVYNYKVLIIN
jgi:hypothetical protein